MIADIQQIIEYMRCPMLYRFRYVDKINPIETDRKGMTLTNAIDQGVEEKFDQEIHKVAYHIFNYIQDDKYPGKGILVKKWGQLWKRYGSLADLFLEKSIVAQKRMFELMPPQKRFERIGLDVIENLHAKFKETPGIPILVGSRIDVKIGKHTIKTTVDLVREVDGKIQLIDFKTGAREKYNPVKRPIALHVRQDIEMTAVVMAFKQIAELAPDEIIYYDMVNDREYRTERSKEDEKALELILDQVERSLKANIYYPVLDVRCLDCPFQVECGKSEWYKGGEEDDSNQR